MYDNNNIVNTVSVTKYRKKKPIKNVDQSHPSTEVWFEGGVKNYGIYPPTLKISR